MLYERPAFVAAYGCTDLVWSLLPSVPRRSRRSRPAATAALDLLLVTDISPEGFVLEARRGAVQHEFVIPPCYSRSTTRSRGTRVHAGR